jgi:nucleoside-diphosphate-sugar epimerase
LRLAGIYGPGRVPRREALLSGEPLVAAEGRLNLIHADDAVRVILAAERLARPPRLYTVSDGQPPLRSEYYAEAARLLGAPPSRLVSPPDSSATARGGTNKRIANRRMLAELRVELAFPTYREGLRDALAN